MNIKVAMIRAASNAATDIVRKAYWAYDNPSEFLRIFMWYTAVAFSIFTARGLLILTGAALIYYVTSMAYDSVIFINSILAFIGGMLGGIIGIVIFLVAIIKS